MYKSETKNINYNNYIVINVMSQDHNTHKQKFNIKDIKVLPDDPDDVVRQLEKFKHMHLALVSKELKEMIEFKL